MLKTDGGSGGSGTNPGKKSHLPASECEETSSDSGTRLSSRSRGQERVVGGIAVFSLCSLLVAFPLSAVAGNSEDGRPDLVRLFWELRVRWAFL